MLSPRTVLRGMIASYCAVVVAGAVVLVDAAGRSQVVTSRARPTRAPDGVTLNVARRLTDHVAMYPRAIRLAHAGVLNGRVVVSVISHQGEAGIGEIYESTHDGGGFTRVGTIADPSAANGRGLCCGSLYEVPQRTGGTPEGTLLWAASTGQNARPRRMALRVWRSDDHGRHWAYLSSCATARRTGGVWE